MANDAPDEAKVRFEATVHSEGKGKAASAVADLDLDRVPDPTGDVRILATSEDLVRLLEHGLEVRLVRAHRVKPLDASLMIDDAEARKRIEEQTRGITGRGRP